MEKDELTFDEQQEIMETHLRRSVDVQKKVSQLKNQEQRRIIRSNILTLHNDVTSVFLNESRETVYQKLDKLVEYLNKVENAFDKEGIEGFLAKKFKNLEFVEEKSEITRSSRQNIIKSANLLASCLTELRSEIGKPIYDSGSLSRIDETIQHWLTELHGIISFIENSIINRYLLKKHLDGLQSAHASYHNLLSFFYNSITEREIKVNKRYKDIDNLPTLENLDMESKIITISYYSLLDQKPASKINKELEERIPGYQEMRQLYYYLNNLIYLDDQDVEEFFNPHSDKMIQYINKFFEKFEYYASKNSDNLWHINWLLSVGKNYLRFDDAFTLYISIPKSYFGSSEKLLVEYFNYFKKSFNFKSCAETINQLKLAANYRNELCEINKHYGYIIDKIDSLIKENKLPTVFNYDIITDHFYSDDEFEKIIIEVTEKNIHRKMGWSFDGSKQAVKNQLGYFLRQMSGKGLLRLNDREEFKFIIHPKDHLRKQLTKLEKQESELLELEGIYNKIKQNIIIEESSLLSALKNDYTKYIQRFGLKWEDICFKIANVLHDEILTVSENKTRLINNKIPDIIVKDKTLKTEGNRVSFASRIIDAKKSYLAISDDIENYVKYCIILEFWILDDTIVVENKDDSKIKYVYSNELIEKLSQKNEFDLIEQIKKIKEESESIEKSFLNSFYDQIAKSS